MHLIVLAVPDCPNVTLYRDHDGHVAGAPSLPQLRQAIGQAAARPQ